MKQHSPILIALVFVLCNIFSNNVVAYSLSCTTENCLYEHLLEVNKEWANQDFDPTVFCVDISFKNETERIQKHLETVIHLLKGNESLLLTKKQREKRMHLLDVLINYQKAGRFPRNTGHPVRQPYFTDQFGTACAVGYLALQDGQKALVNKISKESNFAYIREMDYPALNHWAYNNGFTIDELALVQPGYPSESLGWQGFGSGQGFDGKINVMKSDPAEHLLFLAGNFSVVDNVPATNIIAWNGQGWETLDDGIDGEILDIAFDENNNVYASGRFDLYGIPEVNIAKWNGNSWQALQTGNMEGSIYAMEIADGRIYCGGDFSFVNGEPVSNLAYFDLESTLWSTDGIDNTPGGFSVNGIVRDVHYVNQKLYIAGDFTLTGNDAPGTAILQHDNIGLAFWDEDNWDIVVREDSVAVHCLHVSGEDVFIGGNVVENNSIASWIDENWYYLNTSEFDYPIFFPQGNGRVNGFIEINDFPYAYGGFSFAPFVGHYSNNLIPASFYAPPLGINSTDNDITAAAWFRDEVYAAGSFTHIENQNFPGLAKFNMHPNAVEAGQENEVKVYYSSNQLFIKNKQEGSAELQIFNLAGQLVHAASIPENVPDFSVGLETLPLGLYVYKLFENDAVFSGKFIAQQ